MKLYYSPGACSLAVRIVLEELAIPCEYERVDLATKKTETGADYWQVNAKGSVPALQLDDGELLTENVVIQQYLADTTHATSLLPPLGHMERYHVLEWLNFITTDLHKSFGPFFNPKVTPQMKADIFREVIERRLDVLERHFTCMQTPYLLGQHLCLADPYLFVVLGWLPATELSLSMWPKTAEFYNRMLQHSAVKKALAAEELTRKPVTVTCSF